MILKMQSTCDIKAQLLAQYQNASEAYSKVVTELTQHVGGLTLADYEKLRFTTERARLAAHEARDSLATHTYEHNC